MRAKDLAELVQGQRSCPLARAYQREDVTCELGQHKVELAY
jgi:hypothetical protein